MTKKTAIIIGAGPAGLTLALELLRRTEIRPVILEQSEYMGGISRTVRYKGNRMDIGGHRFFSKSDRVMQWWFDILPLERPAEGETESEAVREIAYHGRRHEVRAPARRSADPRHDDEVMLVRSRKSRIYFMRKFFDYPIALSADTLKKMGLLKTFAIGFSYLKSVVAPIRNEENLEQFFVNRFGRRLYQTFFKSYTEKVWGVPCNEISAAWGAQRIKGLSIRKAVAHMVSDLFKAKSGDIKQKGTETSLIERFLYPKYGPGQMWENVARQIVELGGEIVTSQLVDTIHVAEDHVTRIESGSTDSGERRSFDGDYFFSTMPVKDLLRALRPPAPPEISRISEGLLYRDFITVGLLLSEIKIREQSAHGERLVQDNWIYIQEPEVSLGRLQIFNNWSPYLVADPTKVWLGLEYFCNEGDELWSKSDPEMIAFAADELAKIEIIEKSDVLDATVIRVPKTYPAYFGTYDQFDVLREYLDQLVNLFLLGRNGMHKYNNQDHSMLTAMMAVDNLVAGRVDKSNIWAVNTEEDYHESK
jgi:protoporphyrinogen oxidase